MLKYPLKSGEAISGRKTRKMQIKKDKKATATATVEGYLVVDRRSGLVRAFRRNVVQAFSVADSHRGSLVMLVRIPADQEVLYRAAESSRDSVNPPRKT